ncbi:TonB-dependent receptor [Bombella saccharophila]|uniref:TonB-dependent receptor n=1 Tax=Bombella saccharophila TaxID=2967338 RepID=A0ABT3W8F2_9PROT|nr:TonB-dependent receptor [Bombella saccharophila]MCX5615196.1 TonB-dependent receptor [Bombella saccharophila]
MRLSFSSLQALLLLPLCCPSLALAEEQTKGQQTHTPTHPTSHPTTSHPHDVQAKEVEYITTHATTEVTQRGGGLIRPQHGTQSISEVGRSYMDVQAPTASAFQLVSILPGANVATSDPFGISPNTNISVRGLNGDAIGYVLEGMPLNDIASYGGYPNQFADTENYSTVGLQQSSSDLDSPVLNAAGGLMKLSFLDPAFKPGGFASFSYGSFNTRRGFLRLETGEIGHSGVRGFASYSNTHTDNWRSGGYDTRQHIDFKLLKEWGQDNRASLVGSWNRTITSYYPFTSLKDWKTYGTHSGALTHHYEPGDNSYNYWRLSRDPEETLYVGAPVHLRFNQRYSFDITPYAQSAYGNFPYGSQLSGTGNYYGTQPVSSLPLTDNQTVRSEYTQRSYRAGVNMAFHARYKWNDFVMGYWYDYSDDNQRQPFTTVNDDGSSANIWADKRRDRVLMPNGNPYLAGAFHTMSQVNALYIGDHISLMQDRLAMDIGFKEVMMHRWGTNDVPGPQRTISSNKAEPLPRFGMRWNFTKQDQLFLNVNTNFRAPTASSYYNQYAGTDANGNANGSLSKAGTNHLKNEYSIAEEFGYRRTGEWITASVTFFNYNFRNRQIKTGEPNNPNISTSINAGKQTSRGVDVEIGTRPWHHLSPYASFEYLHATIDSNIAARGDLLPTAGKTAIRSPHFQAGAGLRYDDGHFFSMVTMHYISHQYATFMNDERIPAIMTADLALGYRFNNIGVLQKPTLRLNLSNLSNQRYLSGINSTAFNAHTTTGLHGTRIKGSSPDYFIGSPFAALASFTAGF